MIDRIPLSAFMPANADGCALYRMFIPSLSIPGSRFIWKPGEVNMGDFSDAEVVVVQRQVSELNYLAIMQMKAAGFKVIYDTDDNLWSLPSANPGKQIFEANQQGFNKCALACDVITVSTRGLQSAVTTALQGRVQVLVCPNAMDFNLFQAPIVNCEDDRVVIGWAGSNTHDEDVKDAWAVLPDIMKEFPQVQFECVGMAPPNGLYPYRDRVKIRRFVPAGEYMSRLSSWAWDITLAPIIDNRFNRSKSCIKLLEAGAMNMVCLVSQVRPYEEFCALGDLSYLLCSTQIQWKTKLRDLVADAVLRRTYAQRIRKVAETWFDIKILKDNWIHALRTALV